VTDRISYKVKEAAELVGVKPATLLAAIRAGKLEAKRTGSVQGNYLVTREALLAWFEGLEAA
jgi:excisionase family DNA binding protein